MRIKAEMITNIIFTLLLVVAASYLGAIGYVFLLHQYEIPPKRAPKTHYPTWKGKTPPPITPNI